MTSTYMNKIYFFIMLNMGLISGALATTSETKKHNDNISEGFQLLQNKCLSCHSSSPNESQQIAPPMYAIKKHYIDKNTDKQKFVDDIYKFVTNPSLSESKMPKAIERFGLMPNLHFNKEEVKIIADAIYTTPFDKPSWFDSHYKNKHTKKQADKSNYQPINTTNNSDPLKESRVYINKTQSTLSKNLLTKINEEGTVGALKFCNINAIPITSQYENNNILTIKRVSDKNRNPKNYANKEEIQYINEAKLLLGKNKEISPKIVKRTHSTTTYHPILTKKMCLQCHGDPQTEIKEAVYNKIKQLYPEDKATGYTEHQLRGVWVVDMAN